MNRLRGWPGIAIAIIAAIVVALIAWRVFHKPAAGAEAEPSAFVTLVAARSGAIDRTMEAYGVVAGSSAATRTVSAPRDVIVQQVLVGPGMKVAAGAPLVIVGDTPASALAYRQASDAVVFAGKDLARVQRLYAQHLAANDQLGAAQKALADARAGLAAQSAAGGGRSQQVIAAPVAGIVSQLTASKGAQVAAGGALLSIVARGGLVAQLGVEPNRAGALAVGQSVRVASALDPRQALETRVAIIGATIDPTTRLITVTAPVSDAGLTLGDAVKGTIVTGSSQGLTVPRAAVVYDENGAHLFVDRGGKASLVPVQTGAEAGDAVAVTGALRAGDPVIVQGAYQVQDGMAVRTR
ncbi:MAG TPA: efflux RND transporter periplasmic adaptor subunit [Caulobacteraceae bacterium]|nr:efflux RND transporter periplasmic adaptor subunit [Caulobacteraceae bacterium]